MAVGGDFLSTSEAAKVLGVSVRHARRLADAGDLARVARGLIARDSLDRYVAAQRQGRTRSWAEHTAWGAIAILSGEQPTWLGSTQTSRLRGTLRELTGSADLLVRTRDRARVHTLTGHTAALPRLRDILATPDLAKLGLVTGVGETGPVQGYLSADDLEATVLSLGLREDAGGNIVVRATTFDFSVVERLAVTSTVLAALDAAASLDPRMRGVGERALAEILDAYRR